MSRKGANTRGRQLYGTNSNSMRQEPQMGEGSASGITASSASLVGMSDFEILNEVISSFLDSPADHLTKRSRSIFEVGSEDIVTVDNFQHERQEMPLATSQILPPFPGELEQNFQASNPGLFPNISQKAELFHNVSQNVEEFQNVSQNAELFQSVSQYAEPFQNVSQIAPLHLHQQPNQFGNINMGQNYGGLFSAAAPLAAQGTAVTGFGDVNFQMPTSNLTAQHRESSSSVQLPPTQQSYPQQGLQGLYPTQNLQEMTTSPSRNLMMKTTQPINNQQSFDHLQQAGFQGIHPTRNQHEIAGYSSLRNVKMKMSQSGNNRNSAQLQQGLQGSYHTQNWHDTKSTLSSNVMQGPRLIYPGPNPNEMGPSSTSNVMMKMDLPGNNQHPAISQGGSTLYPVTAQGNANPLVPPRLGENSLYSPKFEELGYPADPILRLLKFGSTLP